MRANPRVTNSSLICLTEPSVAGHPARVRLRMLSATAPLVLLASACGGEEARPPESVDASPTPPVEVAAIMRFEAMPATLDAPGTVELAWQTRRASAVEIYLEGEPVAEGLAAEGRWTSPHLSTETRFSLIASDEGGSAVAEIVVSVTPPPPLPSIERFQVFPESFDGPSTQVSLTWRAKGRLRLEANGQPVDFPGNEVGSFMTTVEDATHFTLTASSAGRTAQSTALVRRSGRELEPNGDRGTAGFLDREGIATGKLEAGDVDWYRFDVPAGAAVRAEVRDRNGRCSFEAQLELWGPDPERPGRLRFLVGADDADEDVCARLDPLKESRAIDRLAGTHYISVRGFDAEAVGEYRLQVEVLDARCGNGLVEPSQGEECEPSVARFGACDASCRYNAAEPPSVIPMEAQVEVPAGTAERAIRFDLSAEAMFSALPSFYSPLLQLRLLDRDRSAGDRLVELRSGSYELSAAPLPPGRYLLTARLGDGRPLPVEPITLWGLVRGCGDRFVDAGEVCDDGNQRDDDRCDSQCRHRALGAGPGAITVSSNDLAPRFYAVDVVEAGGGVTATATSTVGSQWQLGLYDEHFIPIAFGEPGGDLGPGTPGADDLVPGRYYIGAARLAPGRVETVDLSIALVSPQCGDGRIQRQAAEQCDDGSTPLPGCNALCRYELTTTLRATPPGDLQASFSVPAVGRAVIAVDMPTAGRFTGNIASGGLGSCDAPAHEQLAFEVRGPGRDLLRREPPTGIANSCPGARSPQRLEAGRNYLVFETVDAELPEVSFRFSMQEAMCGDRVIDIGEQCDDGPNDPQSRCSQCRQRPSPLFPSVHLESEPNDSFVQADAIDVGLGARSVTALGAVEANGRDIFVFEVSPEHDGTVFLSTGFFNPVVGPSLLCTVQDTAIRVYDASGRVLGANDDINASAVCSRLEFSSSPMSTGRLPAGRYYVEVGSGASSAAVWGYTLYAEVQ